MTTPLIPQPGVTPPPTEGQGLRVEQAATKTTAKTIAHMIATKMTDGSPAPVEEGEAPIAPRKPEYTTDPVALEPDPRAEGAAVQPGAVGTETAVEGEDDSAVAVAPDIEELTRLIEEAALDLGVSPSDIPTDLLPIFERVVQGSVTVKQQAVAREAEANEQIQQVQEFARQLKEQPDRLLLSMALTQPDVFAKVVETFQEMQNDPRIKDLVGRELAAEARLREAERKERMIGQESVRTRTERVISAVNVASRRHGVPYELAEQFVAAAITNAQGEFGPADVESVITKLATQIKAKATLRKIAPRVATPAKIAATATAPTSSAAGAAAPPPASSERTASAGLTEATPHGRLMGLIKSAGKRLRVSE